MSSKLTKSIVTTIKSEIEDGGYINPQLISDIQDAIGMYIDEETAEFLETATKEMWERRLNS